MFTKKIFASAILSILATQSHAIVVQQVSDADILANTIAGSGIKVLSSSQAIPLVEELNGEVYIDNSTFSGGFDAGLGIDEGVLITTAFDGASIAGSNDPLNPVNDYSPSSSSEVDATTPNGVGVYDSSFLQFDFQFEDETSSGLSFNLIFGSEEYGYSEGQFTTNRGGAEITEDLDVPGNGFTKYYNDRIGVFVDGVNVATLGDGSGVSVNSINAFNNSELFNDNTDGAYNNAMDGFTSVLNFEVFNLDSSVHTISFEIGNAFDGGYDSWLLIEAGSVSAINTVPELSASAAPISAALLAAMLGLGFERRRRVQK